MLLFPRYQATVMRCMDPNYPPEVEEGTGKELKNNAVCASITDGGKRALLDFKLAAEGVDFPQDEYDALAGGDAAHNAAAMRAVLAGEPGPLADITALNAGAAIYVAGRAETLVAGVERAREVLTAGRAEAKLAQLVAASGAGS